MNIKDLVNKKVISAKINENKDLVILETALRAGTIDQTKYNKLRSLPLRAWLRLRLKV